MESTKPMFLASYLPFKLQGAVCKNKPKHTLTEIRYWAEPNAYWENNQKTGEINRFCKPILKPITDLTLEFTNKDVVLREFQPEFIIGNRYEWNYAFVQRLFELHFDYFGLIEKGLAISEHDVV